MKKIVASRSVLLNWTVSYLLILLIPIAITIYSSVMIGKTVRAEVSDANTLILNTVRNDIDVRISAMRAAFRYTYLNNLMANLRQSSPASLAFTATTYELVRDLSAYVSTTAQNMGITVYLQDMDYIISNTTANQAATLFYAQQLSGMKMSQAEWLQTLQADYSNAFLILDGIQPGWIEPCLTYCQTVHSSNGDINIFITIPLANLAESSASLSDRSLLLADSQGAILSDFGGSRAILTLDLNRPTGEAVKGTDGQSYVLTYAQSQQADLYYVVATPEGSYWSTLARVNFLFIAAISIALLLGIAIVWLLLRRNYRPLENITRLLQKQESPRNEFDLINRTYAHLTDENTTMRHRLDQQTSQLREHYLLSLLKGRLTSFSAADMNTYYQIGAEERSYSLIILTIGAASDLIMKQYRDEQEFENIYLFAADNVLAELLADVPYDRIEDGHILIYVLHLDARQLTLWEAEKVRRLEQINDFFNSHLSAQLTMIISEHTNQFDHLRYLYRDAMDALEYQNILGKTGVLLTTDYKTLANKLQSQTELWPQELAAAVRAGDYPTCEDLAARIFGTYTQNTAVTFPVFRIAVINDLYAVLNAYDEVIADHDLRYKLMVKMVSLISAEKAGELKKNLLQLLQYACQTIQAQQKGGNSILVRRIQEYIRQNYADGNLNINTVSDAFAKNPRYLSHVFSQQTGEGLLDAINAVRIRHAAHLMQTTALSLDEISTQTGFTNTRTFRRAFMRVTGLQPSRYLEKHKGELAQAEPAPTGID